MNTLLDNNILKSYDNSLDKFVKEMELHKTKESHRNFAAIAIKILLYLIQKEDFLQSIINTSFWMQIKINFSNAKWKAPEIFSDIWREFAVILKDFTLKFEWYDEIEDMLYNHKT